MSSGGAVCSVAVACAIVFLTGAWGPGLVVGAPADSAFRWLRQFGTPGWGTAANAIALDGSNVYVAGPMGLHGFVQKFDSDGDALWTRAIVNAEEDFPNAVAASATGVYVATDTKSSLGDHDVLLRKYDPSGNEVWTRLFGTPEFDFAGAAASDASGVYVGGYTLGTFPNVTGAGAGPFLRKYDADGTVLWTQSETSAMGGITAIALDSSRVYVAGWATGTFPGQPALTGYSGAFLRTFDHDGNLLWTREFGIDQNDGATAVAVDASGVYVGGRTGADSFVRKFDLAGNVVWTRRVSNSRNAYVWGVALNGSTLYLAGETDGTFPEETFAYGYHAFVRAYDEDGNIGWTLRFDVSIDNNAAAIGAGPFGIYVAGSTSGALADQTSTGSVDAFVARLAERPGAPENLRVIAGYSQITLSWRAPSSSGDSPIIGYRIYRGRSPDAVSPLADIGEVLTYTDPAVPSGVAFYYQVSARNGAGAGLRSAEVSATAAPLSTFVLLVLGTAYAFVASVGVSFLVYRYRARRRAPSASVPPPTHPPPPPPPQ